MENRYALDPGCWYVLLVHQKSKRLKKVIHILTFLNWLIGFYPSISVFYFKQNWFVGRKGRCIFGINSRQHFNMFSSLDCHASHSVPAFQCKSWGMVMNILMVEWKWMTAWHSCWPVSERVFGYLSELSGWNTDCHRWFHAQDDLHVSFECLRSGPDVDHEDLQEQKDFRDSGTCVSSIASLNKEVRFRAALISYTRNLLIR